MNITDCYLQLGGDYDEVLKRIPNAALIERIMKKFPADDSFSKLTYSFENRDRKAAFAASHTLKGVSANLGFMDLYTACAALTEYLRPETSELDEKAHILYGAIAASYEKTICAIREYADI